MIILREGSHPRTEVRIHSSIHINDIVINNLESMPLIEFDSATALTATCTFLVAGTNLQFPHLQNNIEATEIIRYDFQKQG